MAAPYEILRQWKVAGGDLRQLSHVSTTCGGSMRLAVFTPPTPKATLYFLSGLTCTDENFSQKGGAFRDAARLGFTLVMPDTSPRGCGYPGEDESYDFGTGAGFYLDATQEPWSARYRMESYVVEELRSLVNEHLGGTPDKTGVFGHSMGGHGALTLALKHPGVYRSVSAFAPIGSPSQVPWGEKAFTGYLGADRSEWAKHDATELVQGTQLDHTILVDQGTGDEFLERELKPGLFRAACEEAGQALTLRMQEGYDHSYFFISTFVGDHLEHHAECLGV